MTTNITLRESTYFQTIKLAAAVVAPNDVLPAPPDLIDVSGYQGFAFVGTLRAGDAPVVEVVASTNPNGTDLIVVTTADLSAETTADGEIVLIDVMTNCLAGCAGYRYVGLRFITPNISGDVLFIGYDPNLSPVEQLPSTYVFTGCECCCE